MGTYSLVHHALEYEPLDGAASLNLYLIRINWLEYATVRFVPSSRRTRMLVVLADSDLILRFLLLKSLALGGTGLQDARFAGGQNAYALSTRTTSTELQTELT